MFHTDAGGTADTRPLRRRDMALGHRTAKAPAKGSFRTLNSMAFGLAVYASCSKWVAPPHAKLASGRWSGATGRAFHPQGSDEGFPICFLHLFLPSQIFLAQSMKPNQATTPGNRANGESGARYCPRTARTVPEGPANIGHRAARRRSGAGLAGRRGAFLGRGLPQASPESGADLDAGGFRGDDLESMLAIRGRGTPGDGSGDGPRHQRERRLPGTVPGASAAQRIAGWDAVATLSINQKAALAIAKEPIENKKLVTHSAIKRLNQDEWDKAHHIALVWDGKTFRAFVDGQGGTADSLPAIRNMATSGLVPDHLRDRLRHRNRPCGQSPEEQLLRRRGSAELARLEDRPLRRGLHAGQRFESRDQRAR